MVVGFFTENYSPSAGGAYSLLTTIIEKIRHTPSRHRVVLIIDDTSFAEYDENDGFKFVNIAERKEKTFISRYLKKLKGKATGHPTKNDRLIEAIKKEGIDFLWLLGPYHCVVDIPYAFTVWDLGHRSQPIFPEVRISGWSWESREKLYTDMLYKAALVITGNCTGKKEILDNYPINPEKIKIIPFPIPAFCAGEKTDSIEYEEIKKPFIFYPAQFWAHKNHIAIIEAIALLKERYELPINCYFVGSDKGNRAYIEEQIIKRGLGEQIRILGFVNDAILLYLYRNAVAMTYVSLLGPNNLPPLEAAFLGCPLIISNLPGHLEQMSDAALFIDATDPEELAQAIRTLYLNETRRSELIEKGGNLAKTYERHSYFSAILAILDSIDPLIRTWKQ